jgi:hypothetical protein
MSETNFKKERYPESIATVIHDMEIIIDDVNSQLFSKHPHQLRDFFSFGPRNGINTAKFAKHYKFNSDNSSKNGKDIKGVYVLAEEKGENINVVNVGISKTIMRRFYQHTTGKKHNESTLGFYMALNQHYQTTGEIYSGKRDVFPYEHYRVNILEYIRNLRFAIVPIDNNFELYIIECYLACYYKSFWNTFETH